MGSATIVFLSLLSAHLALSQTMSDPGWAVLCQSSILDLWNATHNGSSSGASPELTGFDGLYNPSLTPNNASGITYSQCLTSCSGPIFSASFGNFGTAASNWILPWLSLTAQLPYETESVFFGVLSLLLAVGSPAHITYGLLVTILNRRRSQKIFEKLAEISVDVEDRYPKMGKRVDAALYIVQQSHQAPMRAWDGSGWLSSLILLVENEDWWENVKESLKTSRRGVTTSLTFQGLFAILAWIFTIIAAFGSLGDVPTALSISVSSIWVWMIPVITGWVLVGTQYRSGTIKHALKGPRCSRPSGNLVIPDRKPQDGIQTCQAGRMGIFPSRAANDHRMILVTSRTPTEPQTSPRTSHLYTLRSSLSTDTTYTGGTASLNLDPPCRLHGHEPYGLPNDRSSVDPSNESTNITAPLIPLRYNTAEELKSKVPTFLGFSLRGDEAREGPIFNHARLFTHARFVDTIASGFRQAMFNITEGTTPRGFDWADDKSVEHNTAGSWTELSAYCGFGHKGTPPAYSAWGDRSDGVLGIMIVSSFVALFIQWGTAGPAILIAYLTPVVGLGCHSLSTLIYGMVGTVSWLLLLASSLVSNHIMVRSQELQEAGKDKLMTPSWRLLLLATSMRFAGCFLASLNALGLVIVTFVILAGKFDGCYCNSDRDVHSTNGWIFLFPNGPQLEPMAQQVWQAGLLTVGTICAIVFAGIVGAIKAY